MTGSGGGVTLCQQSRSQLYDLENDTRLLILTKDGIIPCNHNLKTTGNPLKIHQNIGLYDYSNTISENALQSKILAPLLIVF